MRSGVSSPQRGTTSDLPEHAMPSERTCSSRIGSPSSITTRRLTEAANSRIMASGKGQGQPSFRTGASGMSSRQYSAVMPQVTMPRSLPVPGITRFRDPCEEASTDCASMRSSTFTRSLRPQSGSGTKRDGSFLNSVTLRGRGSPQSTSARECPTQVVVRRMTGQPYFSESSNASSMKARASTASAGSRIGIFARRA